MAKMEKTVENDRWVEDLAQPGESRERALAMLRQELESGMPYALSRYLSPSNPHFEALIQESIQEALITALDKLSQFRGESKFTTWVYKIAIREALSELRRKRWEDVSLEGLLRDEEEMPVLERMENKTVTPERHAAQHDLMAKIGQYIKEELTEKQRKALIAIGVKGMPTAEVARRMDTNRNALYKLMHDARLKLKRRMLQDGLAPEDVLAMFDS